MNLPQDAARGAGLQDQRCADTAGTFGVSEFKKNVAIVFTVCYWICAVHSRRWSSSGAFSSAPARSIRWRKCCRWAAVMAPLLPPRVMKTSSRAGFCSWPRVLYPHYPPAQYRALKWKLSQPCFLLSSSQPAVRFQEAGDRERLQCHLASATVAPQGYAHAHMNTHSTKGS